MKTIRIMYPKEISDTEMKTLLDSRLAEIQGLGEVNLLTVIEEGSKTNHVKNQLQREFSRAVGPHVHKSAVVGARGMIKVALAGVKMVTGRQIQAFSDEAEAQRWLDKS